MWLSEQTAIISLCNINLLDFIPYKDCVYCAVRAECLNVIYLRLGNRNVNLINIIILPGMEFNVWMNW